MSHGGVCSLWQSDVFVLGNAWWLRNISVCPQGSKHVLFSLERLRGCMVSLFLSDIGPWHAHMLLTLHCIPACRLCLHCYEAILWVNGFTAPKKASNGWFLVSWSVHLTSLAAVLHCRSLDGSDELVQVSIVLGHQDAWTNMWDFTSVLPQDRHHTVGRAPLPTSSQWCQRWLYWSRKYICPLSQCSGALRSSVPVSGPQSKNGFCFLHADQTKA